MCILTVSALSSLLLVESFEGALSLVKVESTVKLWAKKESKLKKSKKIAFKAGIIFSNMVNSLKHLSKIFR